jgi:hypothetical protein
MKRRTTVPDRDGSRLTLGDEAHLIAATLRSYGADPAQAVVPGVTTDAERVCRMKLRARPARGVPLWLLDYAAAILDQIPARKNQAKHRPRDPLLDRVEVLAEAVGVAEAARFATIGLRDKGGELLSAKQTKARAAKLARAVYRSHKRRVLP